MTTPWRPVLAGSSMLAVLAGAYQAARHLPRSPVAADVTTTSASDSTGVGVVAPVATPPAAAPPPPPEPEPVRPADFDRPVYERGSPAARRPRLLHRYVGTVGGQPATALLEWQNPDSVSGSFYLHRGGPQYRLSLPTPPGPDQPRPRRRGPQVLTVEASIWEATEGMWQLRGRPGATFTATWRGGPTGRPQLVQLRETYAGAVRLAVQTEWVHGRYSLRDGNGSLHSSVAQVQYEFLRLPDPAAVPRALRPILSPGRAARRRLLAQGDYDCQTSYTVRVPLNDFGLLGYQYLEVCSPISGGYGEQAHNALLDLTAGRWLAPESQLRPHYETGLARLLARHLLHDQAYWRISQDSTWRREVGRFLSSRHDTLGAATRWLLANAPPGAATALFTGGGMQVEDWRGYYISAMPDETFSWTIPYAELRPLVRPGTPLAGMLARRGLW